MKPISMFATRQLFSDALASEDADEKSDCRTVLMGDRTLMPTHLTNYSGSLWVKREDDAEVPWPKAR